MLVAFKGHNCLTTLGIAFALIALFAGISNYHTAVNLHMPNIAMIFMLIWMIASIYFNFLIYKHFTVGVLISTMCCLVASRIAGIYGLNAVTYPLLINLLFLFLNFCYAAGTKLHAPEKFLHKLSIYEWQLLFIRLYVGFDLVPHFTEKLFAGAIPHLADVQAFVSLGVPHADFFVWIAGLCEFGGAVAIGLGFLTRLGAIGTVLYLLIATILGHHFSLGFIWANSGGGWEYPLLWSVLILSYAIPGAGKFSIDQYLNDKFKLPRLIKCLMGVSERPIKHQVSHKAQAR